MKPNDHFCLKCYKVRHKETGLFSTGGLDPKFKPDPCGKIWRRIGHVKSHLALFRGRYPASGVKDYLPNVEIVEYTYGSNETTVIPVKT